jgi:hypothetical protein
MSTAAAGIGSGSTCARPRRCDRQHRGVGRTALGLRHRDEEEIMGAHRGVRLLATPCGIDWAHDLNGFRAAFCRTRHRPDRPLPRSSPGFDRRRSPPAVHGQEMPRRHRCRASRREVDARWPACAAIGRSRCDRLRSVVGRRADRRGPGHGRGRADRSPTSSGQPNGNASLSARAMATEGMAPRTSHRTIS